MKKAKKPSKEVEATRLRRRVRRVFGPYDFWNFGKGKNFAFPEIRNDFFYLISMASIAEPGKLSLPEPLQTGNKKTGPESEPELPSWFPTLWRPKGEPELKVNFLPYVIQTSGEPQEGSSFLQVRLKNLFKLFANGLRSLLGENFKRRDIKSLRISFPVARSSMNPDVDQEPNDPVPCISPDADEKENCTEDPWVPDANIKRWVAAQQDSNTPKHLTVLAVIDDGIPFAHRNFRNADGDKTRVEFCWLQSVQRKESGNRPTVTFGREYLRHEIEALIDEHGDDEDYLYHRAGALDDQGEFGSVLEQHGTHGAHVMDQACGYSSELGEDIKEEIRIIAVQLPNNLTLDTSGFGKDAYILSAFHYILNRADILEREYGVDKLRLVINLSFGFSAGRLDGKSDIEFAIDQLIEHRRDALEKPTALVMPAGNSFLSRLHSQISEADFGIANSFSLDWNVQPNDRTSSYFEVWFPEGFNPKGYRLVLKSPDFVSLNIGICQTIEIKPSDSTASQRGRSHFRSADIKTPAGFVVGQVSLDIRKIRIDENKIGKRWRLMAILAPTEPEGPKLPATPSGLWKVTLSRKATSSEIGTGELIHFRIQRDENFNVTFSGARQSYIHDENNNLFDDFGKQKEADSCDSHVKRFGTLNGLATGSSTLRVGGFKKSGQTDWKIDKGFPSSFSSAGKPGEIADPQVDCSALADRSNALPGTIAAGTRSGSFSQLQGTSAAAPFVACAIAEAFTIATNDQVCEATDTNYLELITGTLAGLNTNYVGVTQDNDPDGKNILIAKARLGEFMIIPVSE